jgi:hypothetical protein
MCFHLSENMYFIYSIIFPASVVYLIGTDEYISIAPGPRAIEFPYKQREK